MYAIIGLAAVLVCVEAVVLLAATHPSTRRFFHFVPSVFWIYALPMLASSAGVIPDKSPLYDWSVTYILPASLFLLLTGVDLKAIARLGRTAVLMFLAGSFGMMIGTIAAFAVFQPLVGHDFWSGFGALSASWMGGSANMVAVKEAAGTPDAVFLPMVVVDTIVPYVWMGCLVFASTWQEKIDRWLGADQGVLDDIRKRMGTGREAQGRVSGWTLGIVGAALAVSWGVSAVSQFMPVVTGVISSFTWTVILVSLLGLACSLTPVRRWQAAGSTQVGYWLLFFVLTTIGAKASITHLGSSVVLLGAGFMIVIIHAVVLLAAARLLRAPLMLAATASQANIGGAASAPIVAEIYQPGLSTMGLLMAVLGNIIGTYLGILTGQLCRLL